jgi:hypothetical protein
LLTSLETNSTTMKSKTQIEIGDRYWWQSREGQSPTLVEVSVLQSNVLVTATNAHPDTPYTQSVRDDRGTITYTEIERPKSSVRGKNECFGDTYESIHIANLTSHKPSVVIGSSLKTRFKT